MPSSPSLKPYVGRSLRPAQFFALFALCCLLPFLAAKLALTFTLFVPGANNKGAWLEQELQLPTLASGRWQLLYVHSGTCTQRCELASYSLQQLYIGLGAKREQVSVSVMAESAPEKLAAYPALHWQTMVPSLPASLQGQLLLINREGRVLLHYAAAENQRQAYLTAKKMRSDLLRLLAFDRPVAFQGE